MCVTKYDDVTTFCVLLSMCNRHINFPINFILDFVAQGQHLGHRGPITFCVAMSVSSYQKIELQ